MDTLTISFHEALPCLGSYREFWWAPANNFGLLRALLSLIFLWDISLIISQASSEIYVYGSKSCICVLLRKTPACMLRWLVKLHTHLMNVHAQSTINNYLYQDFRCHLLILILSRVFSVYCVCSHVSHILWWHLFGHFVKQLMTSMLAASVFNWGIQSNNCRTISLQHMLWFEWSIFQTFSHAWIHWSQ